MGRHHLYIIDTTATFRIPRLSYLYIPKDISRSFVGTMCYFYVQGEKSYHTRHTKYEPNQTEAGQTTTLIDSEADMGSENNWKHSPRCLSPIYSWVIATPNYRWVTAAPKPPSLRHYPQGQAERRKENGQRLILQVVGNRTKRRKCYTRETNRRERKPQTEG